MEDQVPVLVVTGSWNTVLFSPKWIKDNLFDSAEPGKIDIKMKIHNDRVVSKLYQIGKIGIEVSTDRLCFIASQNSREQLDRTIELAVKTANLLPHTPISGFGVNLRYTRTTDINLNDDISGLSDYDIAEHSRKYSFRSKEDDKKRVNISILRKADSNETSYEFNFHHNVNNIGDLKRYLEPDIFTKSAETAELILEGLENEL